MTWIILGLGVALAASGAAALWSGVSYMPVEWGWSQIIAGATAISGGVITIGLAGVMHRLGSLQAAMLATAIVETRAGEMMPDDMRRDDGLVNEKEAAGPTQQDAALATPVGQGPPFVQTAGAPALAPDLGSERASPLALSRGRRVGIDDIGNVDGSSAGPMEAEPLPRVPARVAADLEPLSTAPDDPEAVSPRAETDGLSVVGRYEAGGASYALFSDGTIEVETDGGTHRFGSMQELKAFLERHDTADQPSE